MQKRKENSFQKTKMAQIVANMCHLQKLPHEITGYEGSKLDVFLYDIGILQLMETPEQSNKKSSSVASGIKSKQDVWRKQGLLESVTEKEWTRK